MGDQRGLTVRTARPEDAASLARIYIESWQDTYAGVISHALLGAMSVKAHTARWQATIRTMDRHGGTVLVAEDAGPGVVGLCSLGRARDHGLGFEGEYHRFMSIRLSWGAAPDAPCYAAPSGRLGMQAALLLDLGTCPQQCMLLL